jgi:hypothetical protein
MGYELIDVSGGHTGGPLGGLAGSLLMLAITGYALCTVLGWMAYGLRRFARYRAEHWGPTIRRRRAKHLAYLTPELRKLGFTAALWGEPKLPPVPERPFHRTEGMAAIGGTLPGLLLSLAWLWVVVGLAS